MRTSALAQSVQMAVANSSTGVMGAVLLAALVAFAIAMVLLRGVMGAPRGISAFVGVAAAVVVGVLVTTGNQKVFGSFIVIALVAAVLLSPVALVISRRRRR